MIHCQRSGKISQPIVFATLVRSAISQARARLLIQSLRAFGGDLCDCPFWVFTTDPEKAPCAGFEALNAQVIPLEVPQTVAGYIFGDKVYACAKAEAMAGASIQSLVWFDPMCLVLNPPVAFNLCAECDAAVRPVHIRNVGLLTTDPLDHYWRTIYATFKVPDIHHSAETFVDQAHIRAYFNSHAFAVRPCANLMGRWYPLFENLVLDQSFQSQSCQDDRHQIFLFQAVLSALLVTSLEPERLKILPPEYNYPYNLHQSVPLERRASSFNDLVTLVYEERPVDPRMIDDIIVNEPLRTWLIKHLP